MTAAAAQSARAVPILIYHSVSDDPPSWIAPYAVSQSRFRAHVDEIVRAGRNAVTVSDFVGSSAGGRPLPPRPVVITFDDGFADTLRVAAPILAARGLAATAYVTTGALAGPRRCPGHRLGPAAMLAETELHDLEQLGFEIGSHSVTHPPLDVIARPAAVAEIRSSKAVLEDLLSHPVRTFAYPHGFYDRFLMGAVAEAGYQSAVAVRNALSSVGDDRMALSRLMIMSDTPLSSIRAWLSGAGARVAPFPVSLTTRAWRLRRRAGELCRTSPRAVPHGLGADALAEQPPPLGDGGRGSIS